MDGRAARALCKSRLADAAAAVSGRAPRLAERRGPPPTLLLVLRSAAGLAAPAYSAPCPLRLRQMTLTGSQ